MKQPCSLDSFQPAVASLKGCDQTGMYNGAEKRINSPLRAVGVLMVMASVAQMGISSKAYDLTHYSLGSWWAGMVIFLCGISAIMVRLRYAAAASMVFSGLGFILCFLGALDDGLNSTVFEDFDICYNPATHEIFGEAVSENTVGCMKNLIASNETYEHAYNCVCASNGDHEQHKCIDLRLQHNSHNCDVLLTKMPVLLLTSCMLLLVLLLLVIFYCCLACRCVGLPDRTTVLPEYPVAACAVYSNVCETDLETPTVVVELSPTPPLSSSADMNAHINPDLANGTAEPADVDV